MQFSEKELAVMLPLFGPGPEYEELFRMVENKANTQRALL